jgi:hypothetical protein
MNGPAKTIFFRLLDEAGMTTKGILTPQDMMLLKKKGTCLYMNVHTGSIATLQDWADDFISMDSDQWGSSSFLLHTDKDALVEVHQDD